MEIRRLTPDPDDIAMAVEAMMQFQGKSLSPERMKGFLANPGNYLIIAQSEGQIAGFLLAYELERPDEPASQMFIYEIVVAGPLQRKGIGSALILFICTEARARQMLEAFVLTNRSNEQAIRLYTRTGGIIENPDDLMFVYPFR
jgi:ribosomal protein S18 acetylase RimI-like enzyme